MKKLLFSITKKDFVIDYFSGTGAGGQYRNKHQNCVRLKHIDSGAIATGQSNRSRQANLREAFNGLIKNPKFKVWHTRMVNEYINNKSIDDIVDELMIDDNLKIEYKENGRWVF
jgi:hypothetical protein